MSLNKASHHASLMQVDSVKPEFEFEVIKLVILRESYLQKLENSLVTLRGKLDVGIVDLCDMIRLTSIEVIEMIDLWQRAQV